MDVRSSNDGGAKYQLRANDITETRDVVDDHRGDTTTTSVVTVGVPATGIIEKRGDHDWFQVTLAAKTTYRIDLKGASTGDGTLRDPHLLGYATRTAD